MQEIVIDRPYEFVPARVSRVWKSLIRLWMPGALKRRFGLVDIELVGAERLRSSLDAGHGVLVASNHSRASDPLVLGLGIDQVTGGRPSFTMAGWHLFMQNPLQRFLLPRVGAFSVYREGTDRDSLNYATTVLAHGEGPLTIFPEGAVSHCNNRLSPLMDGAAFIARMAAKRRQHEGCPGGVVVQPTFIRYFFDGEIEPAVTPVLGEIEQRLSWQKQDHLPLIDRIEKVAESLLVQREIEHLGAPGRGALGGRVASLMEHMLGTLENEWAVNGDKTDPMERVRRLRGAILAEMVDGSELPTGERERRWHQLGILYQVQNLTCHPRCHLGEDASAEEILDMVDRFEEDLTDRNRPHPPRRAVIFFGEALETGVKRRHGGRGEELTGRLRKSLERLLKESLEWRGEGGKA